MFLSGCAQMFSDTTRASVVKTGDGFSLDYNSSKNQENLKADIDPETGKMHIETTATTPEAAIAATPAAITKLIEELAPLIKLGAAAATKGAVVP